MKAKITGVAAVAHNGAIGLNNGLPWGELEGDLKMFRERTAGHPIIMGSKTALSIGKPLPKRMNIILTRHPDEFLANPKWDAEKDKENVHLFSSIQDAIEEFGDKYDQIFIIGGAEIYKQALELDLMDEMILTETYDDFEGDTFFPEFDKNKWNQEILFDFPQESRRYRVVRYYK